tara:strand:- start:276 stop:680 length:405 start_codon:yes stop_codon:yes gene_type:complete
MINSFSFSGNLGKDAEVRHTPNGNAVCKFMVAVKSGWGKNEKTTWVSCSIWKERGEKIAPALTKGTLVMVVGELSLNEYTNKQGENKSIVSVNVQDIQIAKSDRPVEQKPATPVKPAKPKTDDFDDFMNDDIPF